MIEAICLIVVIFAMLLALYALRRRHRWMVERGFAEESKPGGGGAFMAMREFLEPSAQHIREVREEQQHHASKEAPGDAEPPP